MGKAKRRQDKSKVSILLLSERIKKGAEGPLLNDEPFRPERLSALQARRKLAFHTIAA
jgi:hypothetical protein